MLLTFIEERTTFCRQIQQQMREVFGGLVFNTVIHRNIRLAEAPSAGESVLTYAPQSKGAADYRSLAAEILRTSPMVEGPAAGRARRGMQKQLTTIFDGVWIPKQQRVEPAGRRGEPQLHRVDIGRRISPIIDHDGILAPACGENSFFRSFEFSEQTCLTQEYNTT